MSKQIPFDLFRSAHRLTVTGIEANYEQYVILSHKADADYLEKFIDNLLNDFPFPVAISEERVSSPSSVIIRSGLMISEIKKDIKSGKVANMYLSEPVRTRNDNIIIHP
ncbi:hypothetical protein PJ037_003322 [Proteus mirabilis]|nr:hypothetical protein [Proteus mirabilis]